MNSKDRQILSFYHFFIHSNSLATLPFLSQLKKLLSYTSDQTDSNPTQQTCFFSFPQFQAPKTTLTITFAFFPPLTLAISEWFAILMYFPNGLDFGEDTRLYLIKWVMFFAFLHWMKSRQQSDRRKCNPSSYCLFPNVYEFIWSQSYHPW